MLMINPLFYQSGCRVRVYDVLHLLQQRHVLGPAHPRILLRPPRLHPLHQLRRIHGPRSRNRRASLHRIRINVDTICFRNLFGDSAAFWMSDCYYFVPKRLSMLRRTIETLTQPVEWIKVLLKIFFRFFLLLRTVVNQNFQIAKSWDEWKRLMFSITWSV